MQFELNDLRESNQFLNMLLENITSVVFVVDRSMKIRKFNSPFSSVFQRPENQAVDLLCGNALGCAHATEEKTLCGDTTRCEFCALRRAVVAAFEWDFAAERERMSEEFYIGGEKLMKHFLFSTRPISYLGESMVMLIVEDVTDMENQRCELAAEMQRSERLLLNVLPVTIANELKTSGRSSPRSYDSVSILFSDLVGFTSKSETLPPADVISELNDIFTAFDNIMDNNCCDRIKTIGDAYLAVSGISMIDAHHAAHIVDAAKEMVEYLRGRNHLGGHQWELRIGIHSGPAVGGIVGVKKYVYDVFGDAVNVASRMERSSLPMRINVSDDTYEMVKGQYSFIAREPVDVRGKGMMKMYFLDT